MKYALHGVQPAFLISSLYYVFVSGVILFVTSAYALYDSSSDVVELTPNNFERLVTKSDEVWIVEFFAPWCGHCKNLVPEYKKAARALKVTVELYLLFLNTYCDLINVVRYVGVHLPTAWCLRGFSKYALSNSNLRLPCIYSSLKFIFQFCMIHNFQVMISSSSSII